MTVIQGYGQPTTTRTELNGDTASPKIETKKVAKVGADTLQNREVTGMAKPNAPSGVVVAAQQSGPSPAEIAKAKSVVADVKQLYRANNDVEADGQLASFLNRNPRLAPIVVKGLGEDFDWAFVIRDTADGHVARRIWASLAGGDQQKKVIAALGDCGLVDDISHILRTELSAGRDPATIVVAAGTSGISFEALRDTLPGTQRSTLAIWFAEKVRGADDGVAALFAQSDDPRSALRRLSEIDPTDLAHLMAGEVTPHVRDFFADARRSGDAEDSRLGAALLACESAGAAARARLANYESDLATGDTAKEMLGDAAAFAQRTVDADATYQGAFAERAKRVEHDENLNPSLNVATAKKKPRDLT